MLLPLHETAIRISHLSKTFHKTRPSLSFRESVARGFRSVPAASFQALDDINLDIRRGEVLGIIGKNGSGKSTLLRLLSGIAKPTEGRIEIYGSVASILDIGAGFHPDLSGRENIFLRGQLVGISKKEIQERFEEIIDFSGIGDFIDTPVKYYSDGMFLRLAFSLMIHLKADIILLDEVLGVGDFAFQQKCFAKIQEIARSGATVICVSHNPMELLEICTFYMHLENGKVKEYAAQPAILLDYLQQSQQDSDTTEKTGQEEKMEKKWPDKSTAPGNELFCFQSLHLFAEETTSDNIFFADQDIVLEIVFEKLTDEDHLDIAFTISDIFRHEIMACSSHRVHQFFQTTHRGLYRARCILPANWLNQGNFHINLYTLRNRKEVVYSWREALHFSMQFRTGFDHTSADLVNAPAPLAPALHWELEVL